MIYIFHFRYFSYNNLADKGYFLFFVNPTKVTYFPQIRRESSHDGDQKTFSYFDCIFSNHQTHGQLNRCNRLIKTKMRNFQRVSYLQDGQRMDQDLSFELKTENWQQNK